MKTLIVIIVDIFFLLCYNYSSLSESGVYVSKKKITIIISSILAFSLIVCIVLSVLLYNGIILFNNPSDEEYPVRGVDVSSYQGKIDWQVLSKENIDFAFIKATEGSTHKDKYFNDNLNNSLQTSLKVGTYHFFSFESGGDTQAENFISAVPVKEGMLPPVVDVEFYADKENNPPTKESIDKELKILLNRLEEHYGVKPIIYTTEKVYDLYIKNTYDDYDLWIRNVITSPNKDIRSWTFWQYTNRERLNGYTGEEKYIDVNVFNGTIDDFKKFPTVGEDENSTNNLS